MAYEYNNFLANLDDAIGKLPELPPEQQEKLRIGIDRIKKTLRFLKSYMEQTEQDPQLDDISTGISNIAIHIDNGDIQEAEDEINCTLNLLYETSDQNVKSLYDKAFSILEGMTEHENTAMQKIEQVNNIHEKSSSILEELTEQENDAMKKAGQIDSIKDEIKEVFEESEQYLDDIENIKEDGSEIVSDKTSVALAKVYSLRKNELRKRILLWGLALFAFLGAFIWIGIKYISEIDNIFALDSTVDPTEIIITLLLRLAIFIPISWGIIISSKRLSETIQLEEGYAHKETILTLFVGYKNAIQQIESIKNEKYIGQLIDRVLGIASKDPDYIFKSERTTTEKDQDNIKTDENDTEVDQVDTEENEPRPNS